MNIESPNTKVIKNSEVDEKIENNFHHICYDIMERTGINLFDESDYFKVLKSDLDEDFQSKGNKSLSDFTMMKITKELTKKFKDQGKLISYMRDDDDPRYDDECLLWVDDEGDYVCSITYDKVPNKDDGHVWISGMDVAYKYNGYGLSHQLLDYAIAHGVDALTVQKDNLIGLKTYTDHGFEISDESKFKVDNGLSSQYDMFINNPMKALTEISHSKLKSNIRESTFIESKMSNEAIVLNSGTLDEIGHTPEKIYEWMHKNISYDNNISGWKLRTPSEMYIDRRGNCHDQSLFEAFIFHSLNIVNGQLFFIEFKQDDPIGGNAHTLTWYRTAAKEANLSADWKAEFKEENAAKGPFKYWWFENAWEDQAGIHGPYESVNAIKDAVFEAYKNDHDINQGKYDGIIFGKFSSAQCGMSLGGYVESWRLDDDRLFLPINEKLYRVTHNGIGIYEAMRKQCSAERWKELLSSEVFTWLPKPKSYPNGNLSYFTKEGIDKFNELVLPEAEKIVGDNITIDKIDSKEIGKIVYRDKYQIIACNNDPITEQFEFIENFINNPIVPYIEANVKELFQLNNFVLWKNEYQQPPILESGNILDEEIMEEGYILEGYDIKSLPDQLYFSSPNEIKGKTISAKSPRGLFLSPYIGISSIFIIDRHRIVKDYFNEILSKNNREVYRSSYNIEYAEWDLPDNKLTRPLSKVHLFHNVPNFNEIRTGTATGYIYAINVSSVKDELEVFGPTNDPNREIIYKGSERLPIKKVIEHTLQYEITYRSNGKHGVVETKSIQPKNISESSNSEVFTCYKCNTELKDMQLLDIPKKDYEKVASTFTSWDGRHGKLKMFVCPQCGERNYIIYGNESSVLILPDYICKECHKISKDVDVDFDISDEEIEYAKSLHPDWDFETGRIGLILCPNCGIKNHIIIGAENLMASYDESFDNPEWVKQYLMEEGELDDIPPSMDEDETEESKDKPKEKESFPKKADKAESDKNGIRRKKLYIAFIEWCKEYNQKNTFGSIFDKDVFTTSYPFVPDEMRYFYRLANPILCVLAGNLTFFQVSELRKLNEKNSKLNEIMIFAATENDMRIFNKKDKKIYKGIEDNGMIKLDGMLSETFDNYIQNMIKKGDILNGPIEENQK